MSDTLIDQIEKSAYAAKRSQSVEESLQHLTRAFSLFSQEIEKRKDSYRELEKKYFLLQKKWANAFKEPLLSRETSHLHLELLTKKLSQGVIFITLEGLVSIYNPFAEKLLQKNRASVLSRPFSENFADDFFGFSLQEALRFGVSQKVSYIRIKGLEEKKEIEVSTSFLYEGEKNSRGIMIFLKDLTEVQKLKLNASHNKRMKELGEMLSTVAHEIRNPLGGIRGYATLLYRDLEGSPSLQEMLTHIIEGTKSLDKLLTSVLQYTRPLQIEKKMTDLASILESVSQFIKIDPSFPKNVTLELHIPQSPLYILADEEAIKGSLLNLLFNALQAMPYGGKITLSLLKRDAFCLLTISDNGLGIDREDLENIFSPFFTTKKKGTGIGLSEAQKIITAHFGKIEVHSQKGKGTTFTITLPMRYSL